MAQRSGCEPKSMREVVDLSTLYESEKELKATRGFDALDWSEERLRLLNRRFVSLSSGEGSGIGPSASRTRVKQR